jgi:membrane protein insertase Oxa1/YidC/SpoIIIJ
VNPLAGCLPTLVQIPVFIGLYRSVLQEKKTKQKFNKLINKKIVNFFLVL